MRFTIYFSLICLLLVLPFSCSEKDEMLYHTQEGGNGGGEEKPDDVWLLRQIDYKKEGSPSLPYSTDNQRFLYDAQDRIIQIENLGTRQITKLQYKTDKIIISKLIQQGGTMAYDTIVVFLNADKQAKIVTHTRYTGVVNPPPGYANQMGRRDSTAFFYDNAGYLERLDHYVPNGSSYAIYYKENFVVADGNIIEVNSDAGHTHSYTYDGNKHDHTADFCYEMPINRRYPATQCWLFSLLPVISQHLGKASKNNVDHVSIDYGAGNNSFYSSINYDYLYDDKELLDQVIMSGTIGASTPFSNSFMTFTHSKK